MNNRNKCENKKLNIENLNDNNFYKNEYNNENKNVFVPLIPFIIDLI